MADRTGHHLGNYRLLRVLGQGSFAEVYLAEHQYLERLAAIKVLHVQIDAKTQEQFRREARTIAHLHHPHIVQVLEFGFADQTPYLVMEYTPGGTLRSLHPTGTRLPLEQIVTYMNQIASALDYAHQQRVIHRDVKPDNLLLNANHEVMLSDFGIAVVQRTLDSLSMSHPEAGTPLYMAPEQIQRQPCAASDQYALGIMVYEWLAGEAPFRGTLFEVFSHHLHQPPPSLHERRPGLPFAVEEIVFKALAKDPHQRFGSIQAFATALEQASQVDASQALSASRSLLPTDAMPQRRLEQPPIELVSSPSESFIPTELITPPGQSSISHEQSTPPSQSSLSTEMVMPSSETSRPMEVVTSRSSSLPPPENVVPSPPSPAVQGLSVPPKPPLAVSPATSRKPLHVSPPPRTVLTLAMIALVILIIGVLVAHLFVPTSVPTSLRGNGNASASGKRIDVIVKATDSQFWQAMLAGAQAAGKDRGLQVGLFGATSEADVSAQVSLVENSISRHVDAIVLAASDSQALNPLIEQARSQNIKVITVDMRVTTASDGFIGTDNVKAGAQAADRLGALLQQKGITSGQILIESAVAGVQSWSDRDSGFQNELKTRFPGLQIIAQRYNNYDTPTALSQVNDVLSATPGLVGIYADNNVSADGVAQSLQENKAQDRIVAVGFDSDPQEIAALRNGSLKALVVQKPYDIGYQGVLAAAMSAEGRYPPPSLDPGVVLVDLNNMDTPAVQKLLYPPTTNGGA